VVCDNRKLVQGLESGSQLPPEAAKLCDEAAELINRQKYEEAIPICEKVCIRDIARRSFSPMGVWVAHNRRWVLSSGSLDRMHLKSLDSCPISPCCTELWVCAWRSCLEMPRRSRTMSRENAHVCNFVRACAGPAGAALGGGPPGSGKRPQQSCTALQVSFRS
jgi:hypothetical protein